MNAPNQEPAQDDFEVEISDVPPDGSNGRRPAARLSLQARLSRRAHAWRIAAVASALLLLLVVVVVILDSLTTVRIQGVGLVTRFIPTPTATLAPGTDRFYLAADVPWTTVSLDGQPTPLPRIGVDPPLQLARGRHLLAWRAEPFTPQQCSLDVPPTPASSCPIIEQIRQGQSGPLASVIALGESLTILSAYQRPLLTETIQAALSGFNDTVQPGELYYSEQGRDIIVTQPLQATLNMQVETGADTQRSCSMSLLSQFSSPPCAIEEQGCATLCTVPWQNQQTAAAAPAAQDWLAFAIIHSSWDYATLDGQVIARNQPIDSGGATLVNQPVLLRVSWDGSSWHVQPLFGPEQGAPVVVSGVQIADDPGCLAADDVFSQEIANFARLRFVSGPNPAVGCLVEATVASPPGTPTTTPALVEYYLVRFAEFLTANNLAHQRNPQWSLADTYEQALASQLATLPGGLTVTPP